MDLIYKKTAGVRYHEVHIYRLLHKWGFKSKVPQKRFVNTASVKQKKKFLYNEWNNKDKQKSLLEIRSCPDKFSSIIFSK